ncbi:MAG TPA: adenylyl-sulfate kinase [Candidatus Binatia bacterium]|jgi:adenylyl-sulfate kinase
MTERNAGFAIWIVGLASAGKSTLALLLEERLSREGYPAVVLEPSSGKELWTRMLKELGFGREGKNQITRRLSYMAKLITRVGGIAIVPWISPEQWTREEARKEIGRFVEVFVDCPIELCAQRDDRGFYAAARERVTDLAGVHEPFEPPLNPEVTLHSDRQTLEEEVAVVMGRLKSLGYLP